MTVDRADYIALVDKTKETKAREVAPATLQMMEQAALSAAYVTADPHWDKLLSFIEATRQRIEKEKAAHEENLKGTSVVDHDSMIKMKLMIAQCDAILSTFEVILELPKHLKEQGEWAENKLEGLVVGELTAA